MNDTLWSPVKLRMEIVKLIAGWLLLMCYRFFSEQEILQLAI